MSQPLTFVFSTILMLLLSCGSSKISDVTVADLKCEYSVEPLSIDATRPGLSWILDSKRRSVNQSAYRVIVSSTEKLLVDNSGDLWDSGIVESRETLGIVYGGLPLVSRQQCFWKVRVWDENGDVSEWSEMSSWEMALLNAVDWDASWIGDGKVLPQSDAALMKDDPSPLFRREITVAKTVARARLYISGLGYYEASLNGNKIGDHILDPGWTTYSKRILYSTYDVTDMLVKGENALGVILGNGWYNPLPIKMWGRFNLREFLTVGRPCFIASLVIDYADGSTETVASNDEWKVTEGPILRNSVFLGEHYDARREQKGWDSPGFDDSAWSNAKMAEPPSGILRAQNQSPIKATSTIEAVKLSEPTPGAYIFDMGENFAGVVKLKVTGPSGTKVSIRYGELLNPDGTLNVMTSVAGQIKSASQNQPEGTPIPACQNDIYILKGGSEENYTPRFTFHGFRYVELTGFPGVPTLDTIEGIRLNSAVADAGIFECSNPLFNTIQDISKRTFLSNIFSVQSDCPAREKFGYGGDIVPTCETFMFNFDMTSLYPKIATDFVDAARPLGGMTETAPFVGIADRGFGDDSGPIGWTLAHPLLLERMYRFYGNSRLLKEHYGAAKRLIEFIRENNPDHIIKIGISDHESIDEKPTELTGTAFYYHHVKLLSFIAQIIGEQDDAERYFELAESIKAAFIAEFLEVGTGKFGSHTQASQATAIRYGFASEDEIGMAIETLVSEVVDRHDTHLSTGIFGTKFLLETLSEHGRIDLAYDIVNRKSFPGWGHMIENGATTLWEHWEYSDNTYSHNHPMFGSVSEWFFRTVAGINPAEDAFGFDRIVIRPRPGGDVTWAQGSYKSVRGEITSSWKKTVGNFILDIVIPANTTATVYVPAKDKSDVTENGLSAEKAVGVEFIRLEDGNAVYELGSGQYRFESKLPL